MSSITFVAEPHMTREERLKKCQEVLAAAFLFVKECGFYVEGMNTTCNPVDPADFVLHEVRK